MNAPMAAGLAEAMATEVYARLAVLARSGAGLVRLRPEDLEQVRADVAGLLAGLRRLVAAHSPDGGGRCRVCRGWVRRRRWPCRVWLTAHRMLLSQDIPQTAPDPAGASAPPGRADPPPAARAGLLVVSRRRRGGVWPGWVR